MKLTQLSCHRFRADEVWLRLSLIAFNLGSVVAACAADAARRLVPLPAT